MNEKFVNILKEKGTLTNRCKVLKGDARNLSMEDDSVDMIITSPPYVTSYEYADLHQLSTLWFEYTDDLAKIKKSFVGTSSRVRGKKNISSEVAKDTLVKLIAKRKQVLEGLKGLTPNQGNQLVIAYEPVWAIGTGKAATGIGANDVVGKMIRPAMVKLFGIDVTQGIRVLYGGSVTGENAAEFFGQPEIDGALVGGASLKVPNFLEIVKAAGK